MTPTKTGIRLRFKTLAYFITGSVFMLSILESCNDTLLSLSTVIEPCGTIFGNCAPGSFQLLNADIGDFCLDPTCLVPGGCGGGQPLGTIRDICP